MFEKSNLLLALATRSRGYTRLYPPSWVQTEFYREHPQFANADGWIEVLSPDTAILQILPQSGNDENAEDSVMMRLFLHFAMTEVVKNDTLQPYTTEMSEATHELIVGVELDDESLIKSDSYMLVS